MTIILILAALFCLYLIAKGISDRRKEAARQEAENRRQADNQRMREEWRRTQAEAKVAIMRQEAEWKKAAKEREELFREQERVRKEQDRQRKEQERQAKEQARQAAQLERHEEMLMKLDTRLAKAESEIAFNREQIERMFKLQKMAIEKRDACTYGSDEWQKHERKVISLENQIHTLQKRIDSAKADKRFCESKLA